MKDKGSLTAKDAPLFKAGWRGWDWRASKHEEEGLEGTGKWIAKKLKNEIELDL